MIFKSIMISTRSLNLHYTNSETPLIGLPPIEEAREFTEALSNGNSDEILKHVRYNIERNVDYLPPMQINSFRGYSFFTSVILEPLCVLSTLIICTNCFNSATSQLA